MSGSCTEPQTLSCPLTTTDCSPVLYSLVLIQVSLVNLLILYLLFFVLLLGGQGRRDGLPGAGGGAAHVLGAVELVDAAGQQHAVAVQHHGALGTGLTGQKRERMKSTERGAGLEIDEAALVSLTALKYQL